MKPRAAAAGLVFAAWLLALGTASAQTIEPLSQALRSDDAVARREAIAALRSLPASEHDAIVDRIASLVRRAPEPTVADELMTALRRATGSRRADDVVDVADGVESVLTQRHDEPACRIAELVLLARSLERHGTPRSLLAAVEIFRVPGAGLEVEGRRFTLRLGERAAGTALRALGHGDVHVREWARFSVHRLGIDAPGTFVRGLTPSALADVLSAYGEARLMVAMPIVGSFVDAPQRSVREGAFAGLTAYGRNALWVIRDAYRLHAEISRTAEDGSAEWGAERTLTALRRVIDERRLASARAAVADAQAALDRGEPARALALADAALAARPEVVSPELARLYLAIAEQALAGGDGRARTSLARAEHVAVAAGDEALAARARALRDLVRTEDRLASGLLDVEGYAAAARALPERTEVAALAERYAAPAEEAPDRSVALAAAAATMLAIALLLFSWPRRAAPLPVARGELADEGDAAVTSPG